MNRLPGVVALLGLALAAGAVVALTVTSARWVLLLFAAGSWLVLAYLAWTARRVLRELGTVRSGLATGRDRQDELLRSRSDAHAALLEEARGDVRGLAARVDEAAGSLAAGQSALADEVRTGIGAVASGLRSGVAALATDLAALGDSPALAAWRRLSGRRREGTCCLLVGPDDAAAVLALDGTAAGQPGTPFEAWDPAAGGAASAPATAAHAVGAVLVDLDRVVGLEPGDRGLASFLRWLRPEVPVAGFTRVPGLLGLRAAHLCELADGVLLPVPESADGVQFIRHSDVPRPGEHHRPTTAGGPRAA